MKKLLLTLIFLIIPSISVFATERSLLLTLTSNYVVRGITQTNDKAAVQANYEIAQAKDTGFYAGFFVSNVALGAEIDVFGGFRLTTGKQNKFIIDLGAVEYMYTDNNFAPMSHEYYAKLQYELSHLKLYYGENETSYLDMGLGFYTVADLELLFHFGIASAPTVGPQGNDMSVTLQKNFGSTIAALTLTYEETTANNNSELFAYISSEF